MQIIKYVSPGDGYPWALQLHVDMIHFHKYILSSLVININQSVNKKLSLRGLICIRSIEGLNFGFSVHKWKNSLVMGNMN